MNIHFILSCIIGTATMVAAPTLAPALTVTGAVNVSDGDTITVTGTRIRLTGIDAPETDQVCINSTGEKFACGIAARDALIQLIGGNRPTCTGKETDQYGRSLMTCFIGNADINAAMVSHGWALAYRRYSSLYIEQEREARIGNSGLWAGAFVAPWDWRNRGPQTEILGARTVPLDAQKMLVPQPFKSASSTTGCQIKGNISSKGVRIYHVPGQQHYHKTRITQSKGERWFCSEDEARAAGWRRALK